MYPPFACRAYQKVIGFVCNNFEGAILREKQNAKMRFEFPHQEGQTLAQMFGFIEVRNSGGMNLISCQFNNFFERQIQA